jgi:protein-disulfide isomerase-like protein with CxxC motif
MKLTTRYGIFAFAFALLAICAAVFSSGAGAQEEGWQIQRADYGFKNQRNDVTDILKDLLGRGGVNGRVAVNNQTMGGDPAVGKDKSLRIFARNRRNEDREFNFREGSFVDVGMFEVRRDRDDWDDRGGNYGGRDRDDWNGVRIIRAYYGIQGRTINVTDLLRSRARAGGLNFVVTNSAFGGDPAVGADKYLIVIYRYQGKEAATFVREGNTLTIP